MHFNDKIYLANRSGKRYIIHQGGTGAGKTYATMQYLFNYAVKYNGVVISVVAETMPHLKRGPLRDLKLIIEVEGFSHAIEENKSECRFELLKSIIEFFPADAASKMRGARRDILFINECNNVDYESFQQLDVRTRRRTILDFNPVRRFWVHDKLMPQLTEDKFTFLRTTYLDNSWLTTDEKDNIERRRANTNWWKVYGEGEIGVTEGLVFSQWAILSQVEIEVKADINPQVGATPQPVRDNPIGLRDSHAELVSASHQTSAQPNSQPQPQSQPLPGTLLGYGIDFGFAHSPTAIVQVNEYNGELYVKELLYKCNIQNEELFAFASANLDLQAIAVADSAEPKTVAYLFQKGWRGIKPAIKGEDSVMFGINLLLERKINVTNDSLNLINELRRYMWDTNLEGEFIQRPVKEHDHAIDALRYLISYPKKRKLVFA